VLLLLGASSARSSAQGQADTSRFAIAAAAEAQPAEPKKRSRVLWILVGAVAVLAVVVAAR
jgi:hypothetical protein